MTPSPKTSLLLRVELGSEPLVAFLSFHPFEVWDGAEYHSRWSTLSGAAGAALDLPDGQVLCGGIPFPQLRGRLRRL